jgi:molecular chaperone GrpE
MHTEPPSASANIDETPADAATSAPASADDAPATLATAADADTIASLTAEVAALKDSYIRAQADMQNVRRRAVDDVEKAHKFALERFAKDLLGVKDSLDAGLAAEATADALKSGMEITQRQLQGLMERFAINEIPSLAQKFDPNRHQAIAQIESDQEPNTIVTVLQKGYTLHERVLRPSLVTVAKAKTAPAE